MSTIANELQVAVVRISPPSIGFTKTKTTAAAKTLINQ